MLLAAHNFAAFDRDSLTISKRLLAPPPIQLYMFWGIAIATQILQYSTALAHAKRRIFHTNLQTVRKLPRQLKDIEDFCRICSLQQFASAQESRCCDSSSNQGHEHRASIRFLWQGELQGVSVSLPTGLANVLPGISSHPRSESASAISNSGTSISRKVKANCCITCRIA